MNSRRVLLWAGQAVLAILIDQVINGTYDSVARLHSRFMPKNKLIRLGKVMEKNNYGQYLLRLADGKF